MLRPAHGAEKIAATTLTLQNVVVNLRTAKFNIHKFNTLAQREYMCLVWISEQRLLPYTTLSD